MYISISYQSGEPIYEQIEYQIRAQVYAGELKAGEMLPSIRMLAKELKIGIITAKRAYDDLCLEGLLYAVPGKGVFVAERREEELDRRKLDTLREKLRDAKTFAEQNGVTDEQLKALVKEILED